MCFLESKNIANLDLKPQNILITDLIDITKLKLKIIDFGFIKYINKKDSSKRSVLVAGTFE